jgi:hypothetical protein
LPSLPRFGFVLRRGVVKVVIGGILWRAVGSFGDLARLGVGGRGVGLGSRHARGETVGVDARVRVDERSHVLPPFLVLGGIRNPPCCWCCCYWLYG